MPPTPATDPAAVVDQPPGALTACERCGTVHRWRDLAPAEVASCARCDAVLGRGHRMGVQSLLALTLAALVVFMIANFSQLIEIRLRGTSVATTFPGAIAATWQDGAPVVAVVATLTALVAPGLFIGLRLYLLLPLARGRVPAGFAWCMRLLHQVSRWNTVEVLTVAALLSLVRMADLAQAAAGPALFAFGALALLLAAMESAGLRHLWACLPCPQEPHAAQAAPTATNRPAAAQPGASPAASPATARQEGG